MNTQDLCDECTEKVKFYYCDNTNFYYCAHCDFKSHYKFNSKSHIEIKQAREDTLLEFIPEDENDELLEDSIEVWKIYKMLQRMTSLGAPVSTLCMLNCVNFNVRF